MKHVFSILFLCLIFQSVLATKKSIKMRMAKVAQALKLITDAKEKKLRKLQNTDLVSDTEAGADTTNATVSSSEADTTSSQTTASETSAAQTTAAQTSASETTAAQTSTTQTTEKFIDTSVETNVQPEEYVDNTPVTAPESANATAENAPINITKPVSTKPKTTRNPEAKVQITKFHSFKRPTTRGPAKVTFGTFFYFFGRPIVKFIVVRLRITYSRGLRNLQEAVAAETARTDCTIKDPSLLGRTLSEGEGANVDYNCEANATQGDASTANFTLNTDVPMTMVNANGTTESLDFEDINFNSDSAEKSSSLQENTEEIKNTYYIKNCIAYIDKYILKLSGAYSDIRLLRRLQFSNGPIKMNLTNLDDTTNEYECDLSGVGTSNAELSCDTSSNPLKSNVEKLHLSSGVNGDNTLFIEMNDSVGNASYSIAPSAGNRYTYSKSSSGLSGGAIAGIVIACVVALAAASIAAIMLRKPTPPVDNTTIVDLKTETI